MTIVNGQPIWFELTAADPAAAAAFYSAVCGWTTFPSPVAAHGGYILAAAPDGDGVAGIMAAPPGAPPGEGWTIYFAAADLDATLAQATAQGGTLRFGPMDIPEVGRFAVLHDPQGVALRVMQPTTVEPGGSPFRQEPGALGHAVWIELATPDPDGAFAFYGALFGWTAAGAMPMGPMGDYAFLAAGEARPGAIMSSTLTGAPARWNSYMLVPDIDAAIAAAAGAGGALLQGPDQIPGGDYSANIRDAEGHALGLVGPRQADAA